MSDTLLVQGPTIKVEALGTIGWVRFFRTCDGLGDWLRFSNSDLSYANYVESWDKNMGEMSQPDWVTDNPVAFIDYVAHVQGETAYVTVRFIVDGKATELLTNIPLSRGNSAVTDRFERYYTVTVERRNDEGPDEVLLSIKINEYPRDEDN